MQEIQHTLYATLKPMLRRHRRYVWRDRARIHVVKHRFYALPPQARIAVHAAA